MGFLMSTLVRFSGYGLNRQLNPPWYVFGYNKAIVSRKIPHHTTAGAFISAAVNFMKKKNEWGCSFSRWPARFFLKIIIIFLFLHYYNTNVKNKIWKYASVVKLWNKVLYIRWVMLSHYRWILIHAALR